MENLKLRIKASSNSRAILNAITSKNLNKRDKYYFKDYATKEVKYKNFILDLMQRADSLCRALKGDTSTLELGVIEYEKRGKGLTISTEYLNFSDMVEHVKEKSYVNVLEGTRSLVLENEIHEKNNDNRGRLELNIVETPKSYIAFSIRFETSLAPYTVEIPYYKTIKTIVVDEEVMPIYASKDGYKSKTTGDLQNQGIKTIMTKLGQKMKKSTGITSLKGVRRGTTVKSVVDVQELDIKLDFMKENEIDNVGITKEGLFIGIVSQDTENNKPSKVGYFSTTNKVRTKYPYSTTDLEEKK